MKPVLSAVLLMALATTGCRVCENARRTLFTEPAEYCEHSDRSESYERSRELAIAAWHELFCSCPDLPLSADYGEGFIHGYAEHLYAGGRALPPPLPLPPRKYWNIEYATPEGQQAARDWLAGARAGIDAARASGIRELVTVPSAYCGIAELPAVVGVPVVPLEVLPAVPAPPDIPPPPAPPPAADPAASIESAAVPAVPARVADGMWSASGDVQPAQHASAPQTAQPGPVNQGPRVFPMRRSATDGIPQ